MNHTDSNLVSPLPVNVETRRYCARQLGAVRASIADIFGMVCPLCVTAQWHSMLGAARIGRRPEIVLPVAVAAASIAPLWVALAATAAIVGVISVAVDAITTVGRVLGLAYDMAMGTLVSRWRRNAVPPSDAPPPDGDTTPKDAEPITDPHLGASDKVPAGEETPPLMRRYTMYASENVRRQAVLMVQAAVERGDTKVAAYAAVGERLGYSPTSVKRWVRSTEFGPVWKDAPQRKHVPPYPADVRAQAALTILAAIERGEVRTAATSRVARDVGAAYSTVRAWVAAAERSRASQAATLT